jgi:ubiquinone/menaquinone biosynthesis C-methylase UbiE
MARIVIAARRGDCQRFVNFSSFIEAASRGNLDFLAGRCRGAQTRASPPNCSWQKSRPPRRILQYVDKRLTLAIRGPASLSAFIVHRRLDLEKVQNATPSASIDSARAYWDAAAETYDLDFANTLIGRVQRESIWNEIEKVFRPGQRILELNCGTGIDAMFLANRGVSVVACDIAPRMIEIAERRACSSRATALLDFRVLPTENIDVLENEELFDGAFSNFSGLNCVDDLPAVAQKLARLLRPGASLVLCVVGRFVPWEIAWYMAHGKLERAFLRFKRVTIGRMAEGGIVNVRYPSVRKLVRNFTPGFKLTKQRGIGITLPPSYLEHLAQKFPTVLDRLAQFDRRIGGLPLFRSIGDCVLLRFERTELERAKR